MASIATFPTFKKVLSGGQENTKVFTAKGAITAGMVVSFESSANAWSVVKATTSTGKPVGVAVTSASAAGQPVTVAMNGAIAYVANSDDTTAIGPGVWVTVSANAVGGTVLAAALTASGTTATAIWGVGYTLDNIPGNGTGRIYVFTAPLIAPNAS